MTTPDAVERPVSAALEADLREFLRQNGIGVWLDPGGHYSEFVDRLATSDFPYPVMRYRGSFLRLVLALEEKAAGVDSPPLLLHMPGFNKTSICETPVYETYLAGTLFERNVETVISAAAAGVAKPAELATFLKSQPNLAAADAWLAGLHAQPKSELALILSHMSASSVVDALISGRGPLSVRVHDPDSRAAFWHFFATSLGLDQAWRDHWEVPADAGPDDLVFAAAGWALAVEYVHDLKRPPFEPLLGRLRDLRAPLPARCAELASHLREHHAERYARIADEIEARLIAEIERGTPDELGKIDTFSFEEARLLHAALDAMGRDAWTDARRWVDERQPSFWPRHNPMRGHAWQLVSRAVDLGAALKATSPAFPPGATLDEATHHYAVRLAAVDRAHRHLVALTERLLHPTLPEYAALRERLDALRDDYTRWCDDLARAFSAVCQASGFLPARELQQRTLFEHVVEPLTKEPGPIALFTVDALRYEMAEELAAELRAHHPDAAIDLRPRLAELPTVTEVGMNALAPVARDGRLRPVLQKNNRFSGLHSGEFQVLNPETRRRAMEARVRGSRCQLITLQQASELTPKKLKDKIKGAGLIVIHSRGIDEVGETNVTILTFEHELTQIRGAVKLLRDADVQRFVITADHGFLLLRNPVTRPFGKRTDPRSRHVFYPDAINPPDQVRVAFAELGYDDIPGHLLMPADTAVYDRGEVRPNFVHGGNSLQERVIPVLTLQTRRAAGGSAVSYSLAVKAADPVGDMHCVRGRVDVTGQVSLKSASDPTIEVALRVVDPGDFQVVLCDARLGAKVRDTTIVAPIGTDFEVFFRVHGPSGSRVQVELYHPTGQVLATPAHTALRFAATERHGVRTEQPAPATSLDVLAKLPDGVRQVFAHIRDHGMITEEEATPMLGSPSKFRRFSAKFDDFAKQVDFTVRAETVNGLKRYRRTV